MPTSKVVTEVQDGRDVLASGRARLDSFLRAAVDTMQSDPFGADLYVATDQGLFARHVNAAFGLPRDGNTWRPVAVARGPIVTRSARAGLAAAAGDASLAVDMESAAWARAAADRRVPYAILRVVTDGADEELPEYLPRCMDAEGGIHRGKVVLAALANPSSIRALLSLRARVREASSRLAAFVEHYVGKGI